MQNQNSVPDSRAHVAESQEDIGYYAPIDNDQAPVMTDEPDMPLYGLDIPDEQAVSLPRERRRNDTLAIVLASILAVLAISHFLVGFPSIRHARLLVHTVREAISGPSEDTVGQNSSTADGTAADDASTSDAANDDVAANEANQEDRALPAMSQSDLLHKACRLSFDETDLSFPEEQAVIEIRQGNVQITHTIVDPVYDASSLAGDAAMRAAALCTSLGKNPIQGDSEDGGSPFSSVTWIVTNSNGETYLAVRYDAGRAPVTGDGLLVLSLSNGYCLSESVSSSLGGGVAQQSGAIPTLLNGEEVVPTASV